MLSARGAQVDFAHWPRTLSFQHPIHIRTMASPTHPIHEAVNHPRHYNSHPSGVECITVVEHMSFNVGNAMKYLWRADEKIAPIEDLRKAAWYIQREIERRTKAVG